MSELVRLFVQLALFKKGPQDVPYSLFLLIALFVVTFILDMITFQIPDAKGNVKDSFLLLRYMVIANVVFIVAIFWIFKLHGHGQRFIQSLTAMYGVDLLLSIIDVVSKLMLVSGSPDEVSLIALVGFLFLMFSLIWNLFINMHIFRFGLSVSPFYAGMLSLAMFALGLSMYDMLLPGDPA